VVYHLGLREFLQIATEVAPWAPVVPAALDRARVSLDMPAAERRGGPEADRAMFPRLEDQAAVMTCSFLTNPPVEAEPVNIAQRCLERFLRTNSARFVADPMLASLRFQGVVRDPEGARELLPWIASNVVRIGLPRRSPKGRRRGPQACLGQRPLFEPLNERRAYLVVYLAGPLAGLSDEERGRLGAINTAIKAGLHRADQRLGSRLELRLRHPSVELPPVAPADAWQYNSGEIVEGVDGLILTDVAMKSAAFGAALELDLHSLQDGPAVYLQDVACPSHSNNVRGRLAELDMEVESYGDLARLADLVRDWVVRRAGTLATAARRRDDRTVQYGPLHRELLEAWRNTKEPRKTLAADAAGMTVDAVNRMLTSVTLMVTAPGHRRDSLCRSLGVEVLGSTAPIGPRPEGRIDVRGLFQAAESNGWGLDLVQRLFEEATEHERQPHAYAVRRRLVSPAEWERFHRASLVRHD
jgi:hypothetical protein